MEFNRPKKTNSDSSTPNKRLQSSTQQPSWFAGLRSRISQLSMPEWLSQLGIGVSQHTNNASNRSNGGNVTTNATSSSSPLKSSPVLSPLIENITGVDYVKTFMFPASCTAAQPTTPYESLLVTSSVSLEDGKRDGENLQWDWTIDSSLWSADNDYSDTLVVQHFGPLKNLVTGCQHPGKGHNFQSMSVAHPTWCDKCGDFMWGFLTHAVKCDSCNYTCHARCRILVTLDCKTLDSSLKSSSSEAEEAQPAPPKGLYPDIQALHQESVDQDIEQAPAQVAALETEVPNSQPNKQEDIITGSVQIHMNFTRPINVVAGQTPPSFLDIVNGTMTTSSVRTITTFFLPRNTVKNVNISNQMTTREMIVTLLRKFRVADNPRKFALYERSIDDDTIDLSKCQLVRVPDDAYPLRVVRAWNDKHERKHLVLQENDTGDILWDMFEVPELENFLKILDDEEKQYTFRIRQKYDVYRFYLMENLRNRGYFERSDPLDEMSTSMDEPLQKVDPSAPLPDPEPCQVTQDNTNTMSGTRKCRSLHV